MFIVIIVVVYFVTMQSGNFWIYPHKVTTYTCIGTGSWNTYIRNDRKVFYTVYSVPHYVCVYVCMCVGVCVCVCVCGSARALSGWKEINYTEQCWIRGIQQREIGSHAIYTVGSPLINLYLTD